MREGGHEGREGMRGGGHGHEGDTKLSRHCFTRACSGRTWICSGSTCVQNKTNDSRFGFGAEQVQERMRGYGDGDGDGGDQAMATRCWCWSELRWVLVLARTLINCAGLKGLTRRRSARAACSVQREPVWSYSLPPRGTARAHAQHSADAFVHMRTRTRTACAPVLAFMVL